MSSVSQSLALPVQELGASCLDELLLNRTPLSSTGITLPTPADTMHALTTRGTLLTSGRVVTPRSSGRINKMLRVVILHASAAADKTAEIVCIGRRALAAVKAAPLTPNAPGKMSMGPVYEHTRNYLWKATFTAGTNTPDVGSLLLARTAAFQSLAWAESAVVDADHTMNNSCRAEVLDGVNHGCGVVFDGMGMQDFELHAKPAAGCAVYLLWSDL